MMARVRYIHSRNNTVWFSKKLCRDVNYLLHQTCQTKPCSLDLENDLTTPKSKSPISSLELQSRKLFCQYCRQFGLSEPAPNKGNLNSI
jgi:hypothetical protein